MDLNLLKLCFVLLPNDIFPKIYEAVIIGLPDRGEHSFEVTYTTTFSNSYEKDVTSRTTVDEEYIFETVDKAKRFAIKKVNSIIAEADKDFPQTDETQNQDSLSNLDGLLLRI